MSARGSIILAIDRSPIDHVSQAVHALKKQPLAIKSN